MHKTCPAIRYFKAKFGWNLTVRLTAGSFQKFKSGQPDERRGAWGRNLLWHGTKARVTCIAGTIGEGWPCHGGTLRNRFGTPSALAWRIQPRGCSSRNYGGQGFWRTTRSKITQAYRKYTPQAKLKPQTIQTWSNCPAIQNDSKICGCQKWWLSAGTLPVRSVPSIKSRSTMLRLKRENSNESRTRSNY